MRNRVQLQKSIPFVPIVLVLAFQATRAPSIFDDAFITFRYARNIAESIGFVYNVGEPVLGTTTPFFTAVLAFVDLVSDSRFIPAAAVILSIALDCASAWLLFRIGKVAFKDLGAAAILSAAWVINPFRISVAIGGMEASLCTLLILLSFERLILARSLLLGALFAALSVITRPDTLIAITPILIFLFVRDRSFGLRAMGLIVVILVPWLFWSTTYFGSPIPNSILAKEVAYRYSPGFAAYFIAGFLATGTISQYSVSTPLIALSLLSLTSLALGVLQVTRHIQRFLPFVIFGPAYLAIMMVANAPMYFPWYYYPILPSLLFAYASLVWFLPIPSVALRRVLVAIALGATVVAPALSMRFSQSWPLSRERETAYLHACEFLQPKLSPGDTILTPDIGILGWCLPDNRILDPIGLVSPEAIPFLDSRPEGPAMTLALVTFTKPDYIVSLEQYALPFLDPSPAFARLYQLVWMERVSIAGTVQELRVYAKVSETSH